MKRNIAALLLLLAIVAVPFILIVTASDDEAVSPYDIRTILYCVLEPQYTEEDCKAWGILIGQAYEITLRSGEKPEEINYIFPPDSVYTRDMIPCTDPEQIAVAKYDKANKKWIIQDTSYIETKDLPEGQYRVGVYITEPGVYGVVQRSEDIVSPEDKSLDYYCKPIANCGIIGSFAKTEKPFMGDKVEFSFCGIVKGCDLSSPDTWTPYCPFNKDGFTQCTSEGGDCCYIAHDKICDPDCWPTPLPEGPGTMDYVDPDCINLKANPGCNANQPDVDIERTKQCDRHCTNISDMECGACTTEEGDCCLPEEDGICDPDCGKTDIDCCVINKIEINNSAGNCCDPSCDGVCDRDCPVGVDIDCISTRCGRGGREGIDKGPYLQYAACCIRCGDGICDRKEDIYYLGEFEKIKREYEEKKKEAEEKGEEVDPESEEAKIYRAYIDYYEKYSKMYTLEDASNCPEDCV